MCTTCVCKITVRIQFEKYFISLLPTVDDTLIRGLLDKVLRAIRQVGDHRKENETYLVPWTSSALTSKSTRHPRKL